MPTMHIRVDAFPVFMSIEKHLQAYAFRNAYFPPLLWIAWYKRCTSA